MSGARLVVVGSSNIDMVVKSGTIPRGGETVLGEEFVMVPGGKGANQAVCAAKLGAEVKLVARIGDDVFGRTSLENFRAVGVDTQFVTTDKTVPSGVALIVVDREGENAIVVAPGANHTLTPAHVDHAGDAIADADAVILQLEIPLETVAHTIELARSRQTTVILNPAPMRPIEPSLIENVQVLVPNEHEAAALLGMAYHGADFHAQSAAARLLELGPDAVAITLGAQGAYVAGPGVKEHVPAVKVKAVDTTAAGDAFTASLACALAEGCGLPDAARFAARVAAISATRMGAQPSMPSRDEVQASEAAN